MQDATLPHTIDKRIFLAANLKDNEELMPHFILQLLLSIAAMHRDAVFISVYESGSTDLTAEYLLLLRALLQHMSVPHQIVTGGLRREPGQERIAYLAKIRNLATAPMQQGQDGSPPAWPADRLLMLNDVYFCHQGLIRLLRHSSAAIACGIDFFIDAPGGIVLYDSWVMRDAVGRKVVPNSPPYVQHPHSAARFEAGLPIPVTCCWNGIVSIDAAPLAKGVRFRTYGDGECRECEASNLCTDFWQMGYTHMIVDPGVRVAYQSELARRLHTPDVPLRITGYQDMLDAPAADPEQVPEVFTRECCSKGIVTDKVDFQECTYNAFSAQTFMRQVSL
ncbi:hypothetical protein CVIRNUC_000197 [Coccomyxa viridis]|uniref:Uncharacterized protein n=1 Tax=Coccomyxa viridis TaxID=1274662 RepID=A0AAV1HPI5_9CHLO|nr:hypothetical protein CVIRNUC_000197 [Coccomyxa viridis]